VLVHDGGVLDDPAFLLEAVAAATRMAVADAGLQAQVLTRVERLAASGAGSSRQPTRCAQVGRARRLLAGVGRRLDVARAGGPAALRGRRARSRLCGDGSYPSEGQDARASSA
jgi:hypothetical protein